MDDNAKELERRKGELFGKRAGLDAFWQESATNFAPQFADFTVERVWGEEFGQHLFDSAPVLDCRDLGNAFASMGRPRGQPWFRRKLDDDELADDPRVARYLDYLTARMRALIYQEEANFEAALKEAEQFFAAFGNAVVTPEAAMAPDGRQHLLFSHWHLRDCAWALDYRGAPDTMFRKFRRSARLIVKEFKNSYDRLDKEIIEAAEKTPDKEFELCHVMLPAGEYEYYNKPNLRTPFASVYYDCSHRSLIRERPSHEFRYVVFRWQTISRSPYAVSPPVIASMSDSRGLQTMARVLLEAGELSIDPSLKLTEKAVRGEVNLFAGGQTWVERDYDERTGAAIETIKRDLNVPIGIDLIERVRAQLKDAWYLTKLTLPSQAKTAFETARLVEEFIRANIPLFEPLESNYAKLLRAIDAVLTRLGAFRPPPPALANLLLGHTPDFGFANPLQDAIERNKVNQMESVMALAAGAEKLTPGIAARRLDVGEMLADATRGAGSPAKWVLDPQVAAAHDQALATSQQQTAQAGDVVGALNTAGQAADVVDRATAASERLRQLSLQPNVGQQVAYGPT